MVDVEDTVRRHPHITREFLEWQQDPNRKPWPQEMSDEYRDAKEAVSYAPSFTTIGKMRNYAWVFIFLYVTVWSGFIMYLRYM